jgi:hypothetical protein
MRKRIQYRSNTQNIYLIVYVITNNSNSIEENGHHHDANLYAGYYVIYNIVDIFRKSFGFARLFFRQANT